MGQELSLKTIYVLADGEGMLKQPLATNSLAVLQKAMYSHFRNYAPPPGCKRGHNYRKSFPSIF